MIHYRTADLPDIEQVQTLLKNSQLPFEDLIRSKVFFIIALEGERLIGCIGLERYEKEGLLRSMAVDASFQNRGIGQALLERLLAQAKQEAIDTLHLLTTTAEPYFSKKGFAKSERNHAPSLIKATREFSTLCPSSAIYMTAQL